MSIDDLSTTLEQEKADRERLAHAEQLTAEAAALLDPVRLGQISEAAHLFGQATEARNTAVLLDEFGCVGSAADCRVLAQDLDKRAAEILGVKAARS